MFKVMYEDFEKDLRELIASKTPHPNEEPKITIDELCEYFMKKSPWNEPREMDGTKLNMEKLLRADFNNQTMHNHDHPGHQHSLVDCEGHINFFNLRVLGFLLCKGEYHYKARSLY